MSILETRNLCKYFRRGSAAEVKALQDISLTITAGSFCLLAGPSGSGKTTLLALLGALERPTRGQVLFAGRELSRFSGTELARVRRRMGFVFQHFSLIPRLPVWENITYPLIPRGVARRARYETARRLLVQFGMLDKLGVRPDELSGGEQQRVAIARALAGKPEVLLADEPTSNLDPKAATEVISMLQQIQAEGKTVVVASHDPGLARMARQVFHLEEGRLKNVAATATAETGQA